MSKMLQITISEDLLFDFKKYCKENDLKYTDVVRSLIRFEVYYDQCLSKKDRNGHTPLQQKEYKKWKKYIKK